MDNIFNAMGIAYTILAVLIFTLLLFWLAYQGLRGLIDSRDLFPFGNDIKAMDIHYGKETTER